MKAITRSAANTTIRLARIEDAEQIAAIYAPIVLNTPISFEAEPPDAGETARRIETILAQYPWLVCEADGQVAGYAYASRHRDRYHYQWSVDVTVYVNEQFHRNGIGTSLYTSLLAVVPLQGYVGAFAGITLPNAGSVGLHESMGFMPVGIYKNVGFKLGSWHSVGWWQRPLQTLPVRPSLPIPLRDVLGTPAWEEGLQQGIDLLRV